MVVGHICQPSFDNQPSTNFQLIATVRDADRNVLGLVQKPK
jgi:hypothetical protein